MNNKNFIKFFVSVAMVVFCATVAPHVYAAPLTFTVDSLIDMGGDNNPGDGICSNGSACTLRAAIDEANAHSGADTIVFGVTGTISILSAFPTITEQVTLTGPGVSNLTINVNNLGSVFSIASGGSGSSLSGFSVVGASQTVVATQLSTANIILDNLSITGNGIDTAYALIEVPYSTGIQIKNSTLTDGGIGVRIVDGSGSSIDGVVIESSQNSAVTVIGSTNISITDSSFIDSQEAGLYFIGGTSNVTFSGNTVSGNSTGIFIGDGGPNTAIVIDQSTFIGPGTISYSAVTSDNDGSYITLTGNKITGYDAGVYFDGTDNITIGGDSVLERNIIGDSRSGINIKNADNVLISGNYVGIDSDGHTALSSERGIVVLNSTDVTIGGSLTGEGNIVGNATSREIDLGDITNLIIKGNYVGVAADGVTSATGGSAGVYILRGAGVTIGGATTNERNVISGNSLEGIVLDATNGATVVGNYIGIGADGTTAVGNSSSGIKVSSSTNIVIGGTNIGEKNIISANKVYGLDITGTTSITIQGNYFGFDATGTTMMTAISGSARSGVYIGSSTDVTIGGTTALSRNYFTDTGNNSRGISIISTLTNAAIIGNYIGLNTSGSVTGSLAIGISVSSGVDGSTMIIGGSNPGEGNVISGILFGSTAFGIQMQADTNITVVGNKIGTTVTGTSSPGYGNDVGIAILGGSNGAANNKIGGVNPGEGNIIAGSGIAGILVLNLAGSYSTHNAILGNSMFANNQSGTDLALFTGSALADVGPNTNDVGDADTGSNDYLNNPVINVVNTTTGLVTYTVDVPAGNYRIEFFKNPTSGSYGDGETYLGYDTFISTGSAKSRSKTFSLTTGDYITATATESLGGSAYGSTSEFSQAYNPAGIVGTPEKGDPDVLGCMDPSALNYNSLATVDDGSCTYPTPTPNKGHSSSVGGINYGCTDPKALNYDRFSRSKPELCNYASAQGSPVQVSEILGSGLCPDNLIIHNSMKVGDRNGKYSSYNKAVISDVSKLQQQINRILAYQYKQAAGPVDGIFGKLTAQGVARLQTALNEVFKPVPALVIDSVVGPFTRNAVNNSCGK